MIVLDTHVLVWFAEDSRKLGLRATRLTDAALQRDEVAVAAVTFWEIAMLVEKRRLDLDLSPAAMRLKTLQQGIVEIPLNGELAIAAAGLKRFHGDPADRMIVATALAAGATLITADKTILRWKGPLQTANART